MSRTVTAMLTALLLLAAACGGGQTASEPAADSSAASASSAAPEALAFTATTVGGAPFDGGEFAGKDLMLWFWAPW